MRYLILALMIFVSVEIESNVNDDEKQIMNTVCIDGVLQFSVVSKYRCDYVPVRDNKDNIIFCKGD